MNKLTILLCFSLCTPLWAKTPSSSFTITGVRGKVLSNVNKRLKELEQIKPLSQTAPEELATQVNKAMQAYGYLQSKAQIKQNENRLSIAIQSGPQVHISAIHLSLVGPGKDNPFIVNELKKLHLKIGDPLFTEQYNQTKLNLINTAENLGYLHANFKKAEILIDEASNTARITLIFDTGEQYYFGQVQFDPTYINPDLLHRFVAFRPGQPYSTDQVLKLNNDLAGSGYFSNVLVKPQISDVKSVPIAVHLEPVAKYAYSFGAGYGTDTGPRGRAALHVIPVNRYGHQFNALAQGSFTQNLLQSEYLIPGPNPVTDQYSLSGNFSNLNYDSGNSNSLLVSLAQQHRLENYQRTVSINGLYESFDYTSQPRNQQFVLYPKVTYKFNNTGNKLFSPTGYSATFSALGSSRFALSKIDMAQFTLDAKAAYSFESLGLRFYGHGLQSFTAVNNINQLPLSLAVLLGGSDNLKGYAFNSIGPSKTVSYAGLEIQKETFKDWYLLGFYDTGIIHNANLKSSFFDIGAGLMWVSPIGPIKAGLAQPITDHFQRIQGSSPRIVISIGPDL